MSTLLYTPEEIKAAEEAKNSGRFFKNGVTRRVVVTGKDGETRIAKSGKSYTVPHFFLRDADTGEEYTLKDYGWAFDNKLKEYMHTFKIGQTVAVTCTYTENPDTGYEEKSYDIVIEDQTTGVKDNEGKDIPF